MDNIKIEWMKALDGVELDQVGGIASDQSATLYLTGYQPTAEPPLAWVAAHDLEGASLWRCAVESDGDRRLQPQAIAHDPNGFLYLVGTAYSPKVEEDSEPTPEVWLAQCNLKGQVQWLKILQSIHPQQPSSLALDPRGDIYLTGFNLPSGQEGEAWLAKYDPKGDRLWWTSLGKHQDNTTTKIIIGEDPTARTKFAKITVYVAGNTLMPIADRTDRHDSWIARYSSEGIQRWITPIGDALVTPVGAIAVDEDNHAWVSGTTSQSLNEQPLKGPALWLAQYNPQGQQATLQQQPLTAPGTVANLLQTGPSSWVMGSSTTGEPWLYHFDLQGNRGSVNLEKQLGYCMDAVLTTDLYIISQGETQAWLTRVKL